MSGRRRKGKKLGEAVPLCFSAMSSETRLEMLAAFALAGLMANKKQDKWIEGDIADRAIDVALEVANQLAKMEDEEPEWSKRLTERRSRSSFGLREGEA